MNIAEKVMILALWLACSRATFAYMLVMLERPHNAERKKEWEKMNIEPWIIGLWFFLAWPIFLFVLLTRPKHRASR